MQTSSSTEETCTESDVDESNMNKDDDNVQKRPIEATRKRQDSWAIKGQTIQRIHRQCRLRKFTPTEKNCPIPLEYIDITRRTVTTLRDNPNRACTIASTKNQKRS